MRQVESMLGLYSAAVTRDETDGTGRRPRSPLRDESPATVSHYRCRATRLNARAALLASCVAL